MIFSRTVEHAIRALIYLADLPEGRYAMVKDIAGHENIPAHFLAKILQQLAREGMLRSNKGPTGGFRLRQPAASIRLLDVVNMLDGGSACERCIAGFPECTDDVPCALHDSWKALRSRIMEYLDRNTIGSLAEALRQKRKALKPKRRKRPAAKSH
jgi:Rrf2 family transcriptional regulator, iron-sulfur cluster assembly transcription factor